MPIRRRNVLYSLACAIGWPVLSAGAASAEMPDNPFPGDSTSAGSQAPSTAPTPPAPAADGLPAERVLGIGGLFFRARDPKALALWYQTHLGVNTIPTDYSHSGWRQEAGPTAFAPFSLTSKYLGDPHQMWMINFRVRDLDKMAAQLRAADIEVTIDPQSYPNGRFAHLHDPEQNPIELWQPAGPAAS
jgi:glyoxylase I family protein